MSVLFTKTRRFPDKIRIETFPKLTYRKVPVTVCIYVPSPVFAYASIAISFQRITYF
jgi:hypothetical protein